MADSSPGAIGPDPFEETAYRAARRSDERYGGGKGAGGSVDGSAAGVWEDEA
ncbi:MAG TPA: hypothetical protein VG963_29760 [Polyangiaceae bacterium]|nr:hypothetical protein [Polyangiaceae bacterium]